MSLPEHLICSFMVAELGVRRQMGTRGVVVVTCAGIAPDLDCLAIVFGEQYFWSLHHALGHSLLSITVLALVATGIGRFVLKLERPWRLLCCCWLAALVHCVTDSLYWWGVEPFWPLSRRDITFNVLEYLDVFVIAIWFVSAWQCYRHRDRTVRIAARALLLFAGYVGLRAALPEPSGGVLALLTGKWMYVPEQGTMLLDWW